MRYLLILLYALSFCSMSTGQAITGEISFSEPQLSARYEQFIRAIRCPTCEAQNIADSNAPLAKILKNNIAQQMRNGQSDQQIKAYLIERYGDFIVYKPPFVAKTWLLWLGPMIIMLLGLVIYILVARKKQRRSLTAGEKQTLDLFMKEYKD